MRHRQHGLTLLELLVVLLIAGMAIALGFQSLGQWRHANAAIANISGATQQATLTESWLESSLRGLVPVQEDEFKGSQEQLAGIAVQPVLAHQGGATPVEWDIRNDRRSCSLTLKEGGKELTLPLPGVIRAHFGYLDKEGHSHAQWPPALGLHAHLPEIITLEMEMDNGSRRLWAAAITGVRNPYINPFEIEVD